MHLNVKRNIEEVSKFIVIGMTLISIYLNRFQLTFLVRRWSGFFFVIEIKFLDKNTIIFCQCFKLLIRKESIQYYVLTFKLS